MVRVGSRRSQKLAKAPSEELKLGVQIKLRTKPIVKHQSAVIFSWSLKHLYFNKKNPRMSLCEWFLFRLGTTVKLCQGVWNG